MVVRRPEELPEENSRPPAMSDRSPRSPSTATLSTPLHTPASTPTFVFGDERAYSSSFAFGEEHTRNAATSSRQASSQSDRTSTTSPRYTPSPTPSIKCGGQHTSSARFTFGEELDPDTPLPSVEGTTSTSTPSRDTPSSAIATPSVSTDTSDASESVRRESLAQHLRDLSLNSSTPGSSVARPPALSRSTASSSATSTPTIRVTPTPPTLNNAESSAARDRTDSLINGVSRLRMSGDSISSDARLDTESPNVSRERSRSPSRRRRSGSNIVHVVHQVEQEDPPPSLFHRREVQGALTDAKNLATRVECVLSSSALNQEQGSSIQKLNRQASRLSNFQPPASRIVGLVGDSGVGKSSLINSLLDKKGFARASNSGAACTCVVTEYHYHDRDDFSIHIDYFTLEELRGQFDELLRAYRQHETSSESLSPEDREDLKKRADVAINTFRASFRARLEENPGTLLSLPLDHALDAMMTWVSQLLPREAQDQDFQLQERFDSNEECASRLKILTSEVEGGQPCLWPFIKKLRVYLKAYILSKGLVIADLPGLRDLNSARQIVTERYVRECHQIFAVARIGRATTDVGVKEVFELARHAALKNVGVICTQSDDIRANEARHDWPAERVRIDVMTRNIENAERKLRELETEMQDFGTPAELTQEDAQDYLDLQQEYMMTKRLKKNHEFDQDRHIIQIRNQKVSSELQRRYRNHPAGEDLRVFCVSNLTYWERRNDAVNDALQYLQLSGILELRRHCIGIVAESHLRATVEYIREEIPAFLGSVQLWVLAGSGNASAEKKGLILEAVLEVQAHLNDLMEADSRIHDISQVLRRKFNDQIDLYMREQAAAWSAAAGRASNEWRGWHHSSYSAFCRNYGNHYTKTIGSRCWNEEAIETMSNAMSTLWAPFSSNIANYLDAIVEEVDDEFATAMRTTSGKNVQAALRTLHGTLRRRSNLVVHTIENMMEDFQAGMSSVQTDALSPVRTAITGQLLENAYRNAIQEYGSGSDLRRKSIISTGFRSPTLFPSHRRRFKEQFLTLCQDLEAKILQAITEQVSLVNADLDTVRDENVILESERNPEFRKRLAEEVEGVGGEMGRVRGVLDGVVGAAAGNDVDMGV